MPESRDTLENVPRRQFLKATALAGVASFAAAGASAQEAGGTANAAKNAVSRENASGNVGGRKIWFITGTSSGFGLEFTKSALERGDGVVATARQPEVHEYLKKQYGDSILPLRLDVTVQEEVDAAVASALDHFGRLDVVVNNAGYGLHGMVEEFTVDEIRAQLDTNLFGSFRVIKAVLPTLRKQQSGHIVQISSNGGVLTFPFVGAYSASKWGVEAMNEALFLEVAKFGIKVTIVEPGSFETKYHDNAKWTAVMDIYAEETKAFRNFVQNDVVYEDPRIVANLMLKIADDPNPPLRVLVGSGTPELIRNGYNERLAVWADAERRYS